MFHPFQESSVWLVCIYIYITKIFENILDLYKRPISIKNLDINKVLVSNKVYFSKKGFNYFIGYNDGKNVFMHISPKNEQI